MRSTPINVKTVQRVLRSQVILCATSVYIQVKSLSDVTSAHEHSQSNLHSIVISKLIEEVSTGTTFIYLIILILILQLMNLLESTDDQVGVRSVGVILCLKLLPQFSSNLNIHFVCHQEAFVHL